MDIMKKLHRVLVALSVLTMSTVAFAKLTKSEVKKEVQAEAVTATAGIRTACGCSVPIEVSFGDFDKMKTNAHDDEAKPRYWRNNFVADIKGTQEAAESLCKDKDWKKKFCSLKKVTVIGRGVSETDFAYDAAKGAQIYTSEQMCSGGSLIADRLKSALDP